MGGDVVVEQHGAGDMVVLRYDLERPVRQRFTSSVDLTITVTFNNTTQTVPVPTYEVSGVISGRQADDGTITAGWRFTKVHVHADGLSGDAAALADQLRKMKRVKGTLVYSASGRLVSQETNLADVLDSEATLDSAAFDVGRAIVPLPEEAIGVGAVWTVSDAVPISGAMMDQITTYEVTGISGTRVNLTSTLAQSIPTGIEVDAGGGTMMEVVEMNGVGSGSTTLRLDGLLAPVAVFNVDLVMVMQVAALGPSGLMSQAIRSSQSVTATEP
jgi:hypothetical protein